MITESHCQKTLTPAVPGFPMVSMSKVFIMWIQMKEKAPFRVVEMGAGPSSASGMMDFT